MRVKLSKVIKDLNVGMQTIQDFFAKKKIELDVTPNTKIDEDILEILIKEFKPDMEQKLKSEYLTSSRLKEKAKQSEEPKEPEEAKTETEVRKPKVIGKIDLDSAGKPAKKSAPKKEEPKQDSVFAKKDDLEANKKITRIYGHQFDLYSSEPKEEPIKEDPEKETYSYPIDEDEFGMDQEYTTYSLDYYADGCLVDETGNLVDDPIHLVGGDILDDLSDRKIDVGYVRNDITKTDYEICYVNANYEEDGGVKD